MSEKSIKEIMEESMKTEEVKDLDSKLTETANSVSVEEESVYDNVIVDEKDVIKKEETSDVIIEDKYEVKPEAGVPGMVTSNMRASLEEAEKQKDELEKKYGPVEELAEKMQLEKELEEVDVVKASKFKDTIIEDDKEEFKESDEEDEDECPVNLSSIKIKKVDQTDYDKFLQKRTTTLPTTQIGLVKSGYTGSMLGLSSPEIRDVNAIKDSLDPYNATKFLFETIHSKLATTSIGKMKFVDFLKLTSVLELNTLYYGIFDQSFAEKNTYPHQGCQKCKKAFEFDYANKDMMLIDEEDPDLLNKAAKDILKVVNSGANAKEVLDQSEVNNVTRIYLKQSKNIIELRHPSLYNQLIDTLKNVEEDMLKSSQSLVFLMPFIENVYVPVDSDNLELGYVQLKSFNDKLKEITTLREKDDVKLSREIEKIGQSYKIKFGFKNVKCPFCGEIQDTIYIDDMSGLLFLMHQIEVEKTESKKQH